MYYTIMVFFFLLLFTLPQCRTYTPHPELPRPNANMGKTPLGEATSMDKTLDRNTRAGLNKSVVKVRATGRDNTEQNTKFTLPVPGYRLKFLTPSGIEPRPPERKAGTLICIY